MKKLYSINLNAILLLSFLWICQLGYSQPAFTSADMPNIGDSDTVLIFSYNQFSHDLDSETGNGYVWDFTDLNLDLYSMFINVDSYHEKQHAMQEYFPDATIERFTNGTNSQHLGYYQYRNDTLLMYRYQPPSAFGWFPPIALMAFPLEFNQSSDITSDFFYGDLQTGERRAVATYDGYGTLKMSNNTYTDVFRVKTVEKDTTFVTQSSITYINYYWYKKGGEIPILQLTYGNSPGYYYVRSAKGSGSSTGIEEQNDFTLFNLFPNPANDVLNIELDRVENLHSIVIFNSIGQSVKNFSTFKNQIDISDLKEGIYFIQLHFKDKTVTQKFIKE